MPDYQLSIYIYIYRKRSMGTSLEIRQKAIPWKRVNDDVVAPTSGKPKRA